jgi:hypothetical protein
VASARCVACHQPLQASGPLAVGSGPAWLAPPFLSSLDGCCPVLAGAHVVAAAQGTCSGCGMSLDAGGNADDWSVWWVEDIEAIAERAWVLLGDRREPAGPVAKRSGKHVTAEGWHRTNGQIADLKGTDNSRRSLYQLGRPNRTGSRDSGGRFAQAGTDDWGRFRALVEVDEATGCWLWTGRLTSDRYPLFDIKTTAGWVPVRAHRWAYEQAHGRPPAGWTLDHDCHSRDVYCPGGLACLHRRCVRLDHLVAMTNAENLRRRHARRRGQEPR